MIPLSIPAWCDSKPHFSSTRLRNLTVTLWLVIPYSFQKVAKSGFGLASLSFFQNPSSLLMHWWRRTCFTYQKIHNNHRSITPKTQKNLDPTQKRNEHWERLLLLQLRNQVLHSKGHRLPRGALREHFQAGRSLHCLCVSRPTGYYQISLFLGDLDKIFQKTTFPSIGATVYLGANLSGLNHFRMLLENLAEQISEVFVLLVCMRNRWILPEKAALLEFSSVNGLELSIFETEQLSVECSLVV